jgi:hypothetical protein
MRSRPDLFPKAVSTSEVGRPKDSCTASSFIIAVFLIPLMYLILLSFVAVHSTSDFLFLSYPATHYTIYTAFA